MEVFHHSCFSMGTRFNLVIPECNSSEGEKLVSDVIRLLREAEALLSCYDPQSELSAINRSAYHHTFQVSGEMAEVLERMNHYWQKTEGAFDPGLLNYKLALNEKAKDVPSKWTSILGWETIEFDFSGRCIRFLSDQAGLDAGGFGKGWALKRVVTCLKMQGVRSAFISFGESSISVIGTHPLGKFWPVTLTHPVSGQVLDFELADDSLSVSGLAEKQEGAHRHFKPHIIQVKERKPITENVLAVVKAPCPLEAEVLSTAVLSAGSSGRANLERSFPEAEFYILS